MCLIPNKNHFNFKILILLKNKKHTCYLLYRVRFKMKKVFEKFPLEALSFQAAG